MCVRGSWRLNKDCNTLTSPAPPDIAVCCSRSPGLFNRRPGGPSLSGTCSHSSIFSPTGLVSKLAGGHEDPFCWVVAFSTTSLLQLLWFPAHWLPVFTELYNSSIAHSLFGMACLRHQAEITVMQFTGHFLPVHQSMSVPWDFYLVPFFQPSLPMRFPLITAIGMCHFLPVHHFGMACLAGSKVSIQHSSLDAVKPQRVPSSAFKIE